MKKFFSPIFLVLFLGLLVRLIFVPAAGFEADIAYWKWWAEAASHGPANALNTTGINYPPFFIYVLGGIWKVYEIFKPLETTQNLFQTNTFIFLLIMKLPAILSDLFIGWGIYWLCRQLTSNKQQPTNNTAMKQWNNETMNNNSRISILNSQFIAPLSAALYLFNPVVIFDSAFWGQTDSIAAALVIACLILLLKNKIFFCVALSVIALETKVQTIVFLPFLYLLILRWHGFKKLLSSFSIAAGTFFIINLPYILTNNLLRAVNLITESSNYFPLASLNAYNFWWLIAKGEGFTTPDSILVANTFTYKSIGLFAFTLFYALLAIYLWRSTATSNKQKATSRGGVLPPPNNSAMKQCNNETMKNNSCGTFDTRGTRDTSNSYINSNHITMQPFNHSTSPNILISSYLHIIALTFVTAAFAFFMLPTQIHERYIFPIFVFLPLFLALATYKSYLSYRSYFTRRNLFFTFYFLLLTLTIFLNLHLVLILNYPQNGLPLLDFLNKPGIYLPTTIIISWINVLLFLALLFYIVKKLPLKIILTVCLISLIGLIGPLLLTTIKRNQPVVSLSSLKPSFARQDWGKLQFNKTADKRLLSSTYIWYKEGLGTHANSQIEYNLDGKYKKFTTDIGVDTEAGDGASVEFIIKLDDRQIYKSEIMKKWTYPQHLEIPVENVNKLTLIVTDGGDNRNGDHADWLNSKLYR